LIQKIFVIPAKAGILKDMKQDLTKTKLLSQSFFCFIKTFIIIFEDYEKSDDKL